jgi:ubiquinone/menaquinone biosynthesis C-methylase UbiE
MPQALTERQQHEQEFHREFALKHTDRVNQDVARDIISPGPRRWWNAFWSMYDRILKVGVAGKRVLIPGCGFGEDAIRLSYLNARVSAFDLSPEIIDITARRAANLGIRDLDLRVMTAENLEYPDNFFDLVLFVDILHHVDIAATMREVRRVLKPGGMVIGDELYTYSAVQRVRDSRLIARGAYPLMRRWIYGSETPYITEDERKINEREFRIIRDSLLHYEADYFGMLEGRLFPNHMTWAARLDRMVMRAVGPGGLVLGSRVVFSGEVRKS